VNDLGKIKLDGRTVTEIEKDRQAEELRIAVNWAEIGYNGHRSGQSMVEVRAHIAQIFEKHYGPKDKR
jgi:DNA-binding XRE family transcriptional regulator